MANNPAVKVPAGKALEPTLTYFDLGVERGKPGRSGSTDTAGGSDVAVILVTPTDGQDDFEPRLLISEKKLHNLMMDALSWYLGDDVPQEAIRFHALDENEVRHSLTYESTSARDIEPQLPSDLIHMRLPDDLLQVSRLVKITEPSRRAARMTKEEPMIGWVLVVLSFILMLLSLYWTTV